MVITMYYNDHPPAHIHVRYGGYRACIRLDNGDLLDGELSNRALALVREWRILHEDELHENWRRAMLREPLLAIEPLE